MAKLEERIHKDNENDWRDVQMVGRRTHTDEEDQGVDQDPQCTHCQPSLCKLLENSHGNSRGRRRERASQQRRQRR